MKDGKVFGKINLIDLLVLIVAMATIVMVALKMTGSLRWASGRCPLA